MKPNYLDTIEKIKSTNNPFEILSNVENLISMLEKEIFQKTRKIKEIQITRMKKIIKYREMVNKKSYQKFLFRESISRYLREEDDSEMHFL